MMPDWRGVMPCRKTQNVLIIDKEQSCAKIIGKLNNIILNFGDTE